MLSWVYATKVSPEVKSLVQDWLLRHGGPEGRMAATERAALVDEDVIQDVLVESLDAADEHVQAWAITQLRDHAVPEAFALLLERLDSPSPEVRAAVRSELSDFNLERVLGLLDELDAATALRVGELVRKIDDQACAKLQHDLRHAIRPKRIRAAYAIVKLGCQHELLQPLLELAGDSDFLIRRTMAEVLGGVMEPEVGPVLDRLARDSHPRVQDAAARALAQWQEQSADYLQPLLVP
jgi:HEAT repeat protein